MWYLAIIFISVGLDQLVKWWTVENIPFGETVMENPVLSLTHIRNTGAAWSMFEGKMWFFYIMTVAALVVLVYMLYKNRSSSRWMTVGLALIIAGALGNFIDRVRMQYVVDMFQFEFINFPIFNVADISIVIGVICVFIYIFFFAEEKEKVTKK